jgi:hypothetical protein
MHLVALRCHWHAEHGRLPSQRTLRFRQDWHACSVDLDRLLGKSSSRGCAVVSKVTNIAWLEMAHYRPGLERARRGYKKETRATKECKTKGAIARLGTERAEHPRIGLKSRGADVESGGCSSFGSSRCHFPRSSLRLHGPVGDHSWPGISGAIAGCL